MTSEMKALGVAAKFGNGFAKHGGTLEMMSWIADDPELMKEVVQIADRRLLVKSGGLLIKWVDGLTIMPGDDGPTSVLIMRIVGNIESVNPERQERISQASLVSYTARRDTTRSAAYGELVRLNRDIEPSMKLTAGEFWSALNHRGSLATLLDMDGGVNEFYLPHRNRSGTTYFPVQATFIPSHGWDIVVSSKLGSEDHIAKGTRFILRG